jgi:hypothetical protein
LDNDGFYRNYRKAVDDRIDHILVNALPVRMYGNLRWHDRLLADQDRTDVFPGSLAHIDPIYLPLL